MTVDLLNSPVSAEEAPSERALYITYITQFDAEAGFWQYLNGLTPDGINVELVQNDLDAHATETQIHFEADRLICQGNGDRVDTDNCGDRHQVYGRRVAQRRSPRRAPTTSPLRRARTSAGPHRACGRRPNSA